MSRDNEEQLRTAPHIDELWGALESDDELITPEEVALIDARLSVVDGEGAQCMEWEPISQYIRLRQQSLTKSK